MRDQLLTLLSLSLSGSLVALALFALRPLCKRYLSRTWQYYIWVLVLVRLLVPFGPQDNLMQLVGERLGDTVLLSEAPQVSSPQAATGVQIDPRSEDAEAPAGEAPLPYANSEPDPAAVEGGPSFSITTAQLAGVLWLAVAAVLLVRKLISYLLLIREIKCSATPCEDAALLQTIAAVCRELRISLQPAVYINNYVPSPMLVGVFRPFIALPADRASNDDLRYILRHELVHFKRGDIFYKWAAQIAVCVHWFNPVAYLVQREIGRCCELACDEAVVRGLEEKEKSRYGEAILAAIKPAGTKAYAGVSLSMSEDKRQLKERLISIMGYQKRNWLVVAAATVLTVVLFCGATYAGSYTPPQPRPSAGSNAGTRTSANLNTASIMGDTWHLIDNEEQLRGLGLGSYPLDGKYLLNANITLDKSVDWIPVGTQEAPFTGTFNGNGYEIIDLTITDTSVNVIGMFAYAEDAHIYNVTLRRPDIESAFTPGNSIGPVLVLGKNCNSYDNQILDPVEREDPAVPGTTGTGYSSRVESLIQDFAPYASYGVIYNPDSDSASYNGERIKIFAVFKPDSAPDATYSFDFFYHDKNADSSLYLEAVRDTSGNIQQIRRLDDLIAADLLIDLKGTDANQDDTRSPEGANKPEGEAQRGPHNFDATFGWMNRGITATDKFEPNSVVTSWINECDRQQGAYAAVAESPGSDTIYYVYYNGGGRYPWMLDVEGDQIIVDLYSDSHLVTGEGYHLMYITVAQGYSYSGIKLRLDGVELPII